MVRGGRGHPAGAVGLRQGAAAAVVRGDHAREEGFDRDVEFRPAGGRDAESGDERVDGVVGGEVMNHFQII